MSMIVNSYANPTEPEKIDQTKTSWVHCNITPSKTSQSMLETNAGSKMQNANSLDARPAQRVTIGQHQTTKSPSAGSDIGSSPSAGSPQQSPIIDQQHTNQKDSSDPSTSPALSTHQTNGTQSSSPSAGSAASSPTDDDISSASQDTPISSSGIPSGASSPDPSTTPAQSQALQTDPSQTLPAASSSTAPAPQDTQISSPDTPSGALPSQSPVQSQTSTKVGLRPLQPPEPDKKGYRDFRKTLISLVKDPKAKKEFKKLVTVEDTSFKVHYSRPISPALQKAILENIIPRLPASQRPFAFLLAFSCNYSNYKELRDQISQGEISPERIKNLTIRISTDILGDNISRAFENYNNELLRDRFSQLKETTIHLPKDLAIDGEELITVQDLPNKLREEIMPKSIPDGENKWNTASLCAENRSNLGDERGEAFISTKEDAKLLAIYSMMSNEAADLILHLVLNGTDQYSIFAKSPLLTPQRLESLERGNWFLPPTKGTQAAMTDLFNAIKDPNSNIEDIKQKTASLIATFDYKKGDSTNSLGGFFTTKPVAPEETAATQETASVSTSSSTTPAASPASPAATPTATTTDDQPPSDHPTAAPAPASAASDTASSISPDTTPSASPTSPASPTATPAATTTVVQPPSDHQTAPSKGWTTAHPTKKTEPETFLSH